MTKTFQKESDAKNNLISADLVRAKFDYNQETGIFLIREIPGDKWFNWRHGGKIAGTSIKKPTDYVRLCILGKCFYAHIIAWLYVTGEFPKDEIDHINGIRSDNRFENLREASHSENGKNRGLSKNNTSGYKGVSFHRRSGKWKVKVGFNGKGYCPGVYTTKEEAAQVYEKTAKELHGEFMRSKQK